MHNNKIKKKEDLGNSFMGNRTPVQREKLKSQKAVEDLGRRKR